jgi:hypothetical protein
MGPAILTKKTNFPSINIQRSSLYQIQTILNLLRSRLNKWVAAICVAVLEITTMLLKGCTVVIKRLGNV